MRVVTLIPLDKKGKQIIKMHGDRWEVVETRDRVLFSNEKGPWVLVQPLSEERAPANDVRSARIETASRWVHAFYDFKFKIVP